MATQAQHSDVNLAEFGSGPFAGLKAVDEAAINAFDASLAKYSPDVELVSGSPARILSERVTRFVKSFTSLNIDSIQRKFNWYERFTGLDLIARINFDLAAHNLAGEMQGVVEAAATARRALAALKADLPRLASTQTSHEHLIMATHAFLKMPKADEYHVGRLQRRLANLEALFAANRMAEAQIKLAIESLTNLLDRFADIQQLLFPVWQHHALAVAQSEATDGATENAMAQFQAAHSQLAKRLARTD